MILPCASVSKTAESFDSASVQWSKIKETETGFQHQKLKPVVRSQKEAIKKEDQTPSRRIYWASDLKAGDWSIEIDSVDLDDDSLYQCDIQTESNQEKLLLELVVNRKCSVFLHDWKLYYYTEGYRNLTLFN